MISLTRATPFRVIDVFVDALNSAKVKSETVPGTWAASAFDNCVAALGLGLGGDLVKITATAFEIMLITAIAAVKEDRGIYCRAKNYTYGEVAEPIVHSTR